MKKIRETGKSLFVSVLQAQVIWAASAVLLLLVFCGAACTAEDPDSIVQPLALCALYLSSLVGGIAAVKFSDDGIASGILSGICTAGIVRLLSLLPLPSSGTELSLGLICTALIVPAAAAGAVLGHRRRGPADPKKRFGKNIR